MALLMCEALPPTLWALGTPRAPEVLGPPILQDAFVATCQREKTGLRSLREMPVGGEMSHALDCRRVGGFR